jgi:hypothetical protein
MGLAGNDEGLEDYSKVLIQTNNEESQAFLWDWQVILKIGR